MAQTPRRVFFLIYDQVEMLDLAGPYEVFSMANVVSGKVEFELYTVSPDRDPQTGNPRLVSPMRHGEAKSLGLDLRATHTIDHWPDDEPIDMLVIPGGDPELTRKFKDKYPAVIEWIAGQRQKVSILATVCVGALIAAQANVFDGLKATTHVIFIPTLRTLTSSGNTTVVERVRFVDNDKPSHNVISSAGVSAGIDMALHIVGKLLGDAIRVGTADAMEYILDRNT